MARDTLRHGGAYAALPEKAEMAVANPGSFVAGDKRFQ